MADKKSYFQKFVLSTRIKLPSGKNPPWVPVGNNTGALETSDADLIAELNAASESGRGGVKVIDKATFEDLKKNSGQTSRRRDTWKPRMTANLESNPLLQSRSPKSEKSSVAAAAPNKPTVAKTEAPATATGVFPSDAPPIV